MLREFYVYPDICAPINFVQIETFTLSLDGRIKANVVLGGNTDVSSASISYSFDNGPKTSLEV